MENYIHPTAVIGPNVRMGKGNYIGPFCIIGFPAEHKSYWGKEQKAVQIGNNNVFTGHVTIDSGTEKDTIIGNGCWLLKHSHVGHDATLFHSVTLSCGAKVGGFCYIGSGTNIGLNASIHQRVEVPAGCMIGMNAAVTKNLVMKPLRKYVGVPARDIGHNLLQMDCEPPSADTNTVVEKTLWDWIKENSTFKVLGESQGKYIFTLSNVKDPPVMILVPSEGKAYTSGLGLLCSSKEDLINILKLLGHNI